MTPGETSAALLRAAEPFAKNLYHCMRCNYCVEMSWEERGIHRVCPTLIHHSPAPSYSGKGYLAAARAIMEGEELPITSLVERFFNCTTCGNCEEVCPVGLQPAHLVKQFRSAMVEQGLAPDAIAAIAANVAEHHNPAGAPLQELNRYAEGVDISDSATTLYLPGCAASYDTPSEARATLSLLGQAGIAAKLLSPAQVRCCGAPLEETGNFARAAIERSGLAAAIDESGCKTVVASGAECCEALASAKIRDDVQLTNAFDLLERLIVERRVAIEPRAEIEFGGVIALLDSCHLTKKSHVSIAGADFPRRMRALLESLGCKLATVADAANFAICCGAAGGMPQVSPESAARMAKGKLDGFALVGATVVLSASPLCTAHLRRSQTESPTVMGLFEFIDAHFQLRPL